MKKLLFLLPLLLIGSCGLGQPENTVTTIEPGNQTKYETELKQASSKIKDSEEFKACMNMNVPMCIQSAGMQLAQKEKSTEFCKELPNTEQQEACVFTVTLLGAEEKGDESLCSTLAPSYKAQCEKSIIRSKAIKGNDPKLCEMIPVSDGVADNSQDECKLNVIVSDTKSTSESCGLIEKTEIKRMCTDMLKTRTLPSTEQP